MARNLMVAVQPSSIAGFIPIPRLREVDRVTVAAAPDVAWKAVRNLDLYELRWVRALFRLRGAKVRTATGRSAAALEAALRGSEGAVTDGTHRVDGCAESKPMWKRLIVAYDFSTYAQNALSTAIELARSQGTSVTLLHACELPPDLINNRVTLPSGVESTLQSGAFVERAALVELEKVAAPLRAEGLRVDTRATIGRAVDVILSASDSADAIVMGTHGRTGLAHFFLGSVAENVVRRASVPVVTVHAAESQPVVGRAASLAAVDM